jgi:hypothetical protein
MATDDRAEALAPLKAEVIDDVLAAVVLDQHQVGTALPVLEGHGGELVEGPLPEPVAVAQDQPARGYHNYLAGWRGRGVGSEGGGRPQREQGGGASAFTPARIASARLARRALRSGSRLKKAMVPGGIRPVSTLSRVSISVIEGSHRQARAAA